MNCKSIKKEGLFYNIITSPYMLYGATFLVLVALCSLFPYSGDDWAWGSQIGIDRLSTWFDNYSGRYLGNIIVLCLTRARWLRNIVMSLMLTGMIAIICELTSKQKRSRVFWVVCAVLVFMPRAILSQGIVWTAGFANYSTSIFLSLVYVYCVYDIYSKKPDNSIVLAIMYLVLGFANGLIVEHFTLFNIAFGAWVILFCLIKYKRIFIQYVGFLVGVIIGAALMFSNSVYRSVAEGSDGYRSISSEQGLLYRMTNNFGSTIVQYGMLRNTAILIAILILFILLTIVLYKRLKEYQKILMISTTSVLFVYIIYSISYLNMTYKINKFSSAFAVICSISILVFVCAMPVEICKKIPLFVSLGCCCCSMAPLLVVTPIGSRCFVGAYMFFVLFIAQLIELLYENAESEKVISVLSKICIIPLLIGLVYLFVIYFRINEVDKYRIETAVMDSAVSDTVYVMDLPYEPYVWTDSVKSKVWNERFKLFYGIPKEVKVEQIDYIESFFSK